MKKNYLWLIALFSLVGCGENASINDNSSNQTTTSEDRVESLYGEQFTDQIIGNLKVDLPFMEADEYNCEVKEDSFGDPLVCLYLFYNDASIDLSSKLEEYSLICESENYTTTMSTQREFDQSTGTFSEYNLFYADKNIDDVNAVELQFLVGAKDSKDCIGIFAFNYIIVDPASWPTNLVLDVIGEDVPHLPDDGSYTYSASQEIDSETGTEYVFISIKGAYYDEEEAYRDLLKTLNFTIDETQYDTYGYFVYSPDNSYVIQFKYSESYTDLEIYIWRLN